MTDSIRQINQIIKSKAISLRRRGKTYGEIRKITGVDIPKSSLSYWCTNISLSKRQKNHIKESVFLNIQRAREKAWLVNKDRRDKYLQSVRARNEHLAGILKDRDIAKVALAVLYLGEGSKTIRGSVMFGNSGPSVIKIFIWLLRYCYKIDESKFRCTLQCRADQDIKKLEKFWSDITKIPLDQFYKARIDPRTIGKPSKKLDYKGVCRIDYFSGEIAIELKQIIEILYAGI